MSADAGDSLVSLLARRSLHVGTQILRDDMPQPLMFSFDRGIRLLPDYRPVEPDFDASIISSSGTVGEFGAVGEGDNGEVT